MSVNIKDVAKKAKVSTATVSHVINNTRRVSEKTRQLVIDAIKELNYTPNVTARNLRSQSSKTIGLILPDISNSFFTSVVEGIDRVLQKNGYHLLVSNSNENILKEIEQLKMLKSQMLGGLIIASSSNDYEEIQSYIDENIPIVFIDRKLKNNPHDFVTVENELGAYKAVEYLIKNGHENIGMISGLPSISSSKERIKGYKKAHKDYEIDINEQYIQLGDSKLQSGINLTEKLLDMNVTALFIANNLMTIGSMICLKKHNVKIPDQISVIGFDDYDWAMITDPPLTVIKQPPNQIGDKAANLLINKIKHPDKNKETVKFPTELIIRGSG